MSGRKRKKKRKGKSLPSIKTRDGYFELFIERQRKRKKKELIT